MSNLIVEVTKVDKIDNHPNADKLSIATIKGWKVIIRKDEETNEPEYKVGEKCIYIPPDAMLTKDLAEKRLNVTKYLKPVKDDEEYVGIVRATKLRGENSFGLLVKIDESYGDDPNWEIGTDLTEHLKIKKWEPPVKNNVMDAVERENPNFHKYTSIQHFANYNKVISEDEEIIITEKIHGKNCRLGMINEECKDVFACGSHNVRLKEFTYKYKKTYLDYLIENKIVKNKKEIGVDKIINFNNKKYKVLSNNVKPFSIFNIFKRSKNEDIFCKLVEINDNLEEVKYYSEFWEILIKNDNIKEMIKYLYNDYLDEKVYSVVVFGELYGKDVQKGMFYGMKEKKFMAFDISINKNYIDYNEFKSICDKFGVETVPILWEGKFDKDVIYKLTDGNTTVKGDEKIKGFKGREGVVIKLKNERVDTKYNLGRVILKSISADYLSRNDIDDGH